MSPILPDHIAVVHDWLDNPGGAERVLSEIVRCFPQADIFAVADVLSDAERNALLGKPVVTSFIQKLPGARKHFRRYLPLMPLAVEQLDLSKYDVVISSSWAVAKGVITSADQLHLAYVHTPIRYAWDQQHEYLSRGGITGGLQGAVARLALHWLRVWDLRTSNGVDVWLANSFNVARRIQKTYGKKAQVLYPPVAVETLPFATEKQDFYLTCSRLVAYKRIDLLVSAFLQRPDRRLIVVGDGPERARLERMAGSAANISFLGRQPDENVQMLMRDARAFLFAANEDFGIAPVEAQACGTPVVAYGRGGALETIKGLETDAPTGCFYHEQTPEALEHAIDTFETFSHRFHAEACRANATRFRAEKFRNTLQRIVNEKWAEMVVQSRATDWALTGSDRVETSLATSGSD